MKLDIREFKLHIYGKRETANVRFKLRISTKHFTTLVASKYCITDHSEFKMYEGEVVYLKKIHKNPPPKHAGF